MISNQTIINCLEEAKTIANMDLLLADNSGIVITTHFDIVCRNTDSAAAPKVSSGSAMVTA